MYQPRNLAIVIVGEADHGDLLNILDDFEESIINDVLRSTDPSSVRLSIPLSRPS